LPRPTKRAARSDSAATLAAIEDFLASARQPVVQEPGQTPIALAAGCYEVAEKAGAVTLSAWNERTQLFRRVSSITAARQGRLTASIERFGGKTGSLVIYDAALPQTEPLRRQGDRYVFREALRWMLAKTFPGWSLRELSADLDLEHTLSANYPRALLRKGTTGIAVTGAGETSPARALTYGLIWLDYLRRREPSLVIETLALFVPPEALTVTALRLRFLENTTFRLFSYSPEGFAQEVDIADHGNLRTELFPPNRKPSITGEEALLESILRQNPQALDATLEPAPVYSQVTAIAGVDHAIADLLAVDRDGRLAVIELKTTEDPNLPLQALDYWMRVAHHLEQGDFGKTGYFPGVALNPAIPRLLLTAPAFAFHPATETILRFFSSNIPVERIGIGIEWRERVRVLFRYRGVERSRE